MAETFVLIPGAWHYAELLRPVVDRMKERGHQAVAATPAGHGPNANRNVSLQDSIDSIVRFIVERDLHDVVLLGHSYGGVVISGAVQHIPERIKRLIYWCAFVIEDGQSLNDNVPAAYVQLFDSLAAQSSDNTVMLPLEIWKTAFIQDAPPELAESTYTQLCPEPYRGFTDRLSMKRFYELDTPRSVLFCRQDRSLPEGWWHPKMSSRLGEARLVEMDGSHESCFTRPIELADRMVEAGIP